MPTGSRSLGQARKDQHGLLGALIRPIFNQPDRERARDALSTAVTQLDGRLPKVAAMLEDAEDDILAFYTFPVDHRRKIRSTNPLERFNREIGRRTDVVGIFPDDASLIRLASMIAIEAKDEWLLGRAYLARHTMNSLANRGASPTTPPRRSKSFKRPKQPSSPATSSTPNSYTTSQDLTAFTRRRHPEP